MCQKRKSILITDVYKRQGGARSYADAVSFVEAGATRIGTSAGVAILKGELADGDY